MRGWLDGFAARPLNKAAYQDCEDTTNRRDAILNGNRIDAMGDGTGAILCELLATFELYVRE